MMLLMHTKAKRPINYQKGGGYLGILNSIDRLQWTYSEVLNYLLQIGPGIYLNL